MFPHVTHVVKKSKPLLSAKINQHANGNDHHHSPHDEIPIFPLEFWQNFKIGAVHPYDKC